MSKSDSQEKDKFPKHLDHLNKTFVEELSYKLWVTKGARFKAHKRLMERNSLSTSAVAYLTAYLIIFGLIGVYQSVENPFIGLRYIGFGSMAGSILVLIFAQLESARNYRLEAHLYHTCALEISELYNEVRIRKTLEITGDVITDQEFCESIEKRYTDLLKKYPNHSDIDFKLFRVEKKGDYFKDISTFQVVIWKVEYVIQNKLIYYLLIILPPLIFMMYWLK